ncbi:MAG: hypothetical protein WC969_04720 [Elusimicrobiota bacterium]|jgi:hypothetical protein
MNRLTVVALLAALALGASAEMYLRPMAGGEPVEVTMERFSVGAALKALGTMNTGMERLAKLEKPGKGKDAQAKAIMREREAYDAPRVLKGTLLKQDYLIKKLRYELALEQYKKGELGAERFAVLNTEYQGAETAFKDFWNTFGGFAD